MKVLVAGGAGLLGAAVARRLVAAGSAVIAADSFGDWGDGRAVHEERAARLSERPGAVVIRADLTDPLVLEGLFADHRPDAVVNAARFVPKGTGAVPLIEASVAAGIEYFVQLSDADLYGPPAEPDLRAREDEPLDTGPWPAVARKADEEARVAASGVPFIVLRVFELLGPGLPVGRFPMEALEAILAGEETFLPDESPRDFLHVEDAAGGVVTALTARPPGRIVNLGSGRPVRPRDVLEGLARLTGKELKLAPSSPSPHARVPRIADMETAWSTLGFSPRYTLDGILGEIVRHRLLTAGAAPPEPLPRPPAREGPRPVSRRELFDLFRRPFGGR